LSGDKVVGNTKIKLFPVTNGAQMFLHHILVGTDLVGVAVALQSSGSEAFLDKGSHSSWLNDSRAAGL
jgi:hypothetical protein